ASELVGGLDLNSQGKSVGSFDHATCRVHQRGVNTVAHKVPGEHLAEKVTLIPIQARHEEELMIGRCVAEGVGDSGLPAIFGSHGPAAVSHPDRVYLECLATKSNSTLHTTGLVEMPSATG